MEINLSSDLEVGIYHYFVTPCQIVQFRNMTVDERVSANKGVDAHCFASGANFMHFLRVAPSAKGEGGLHSYRFTVAVAASNFSMRPAKEVSICANEVGDKRVPFSFPTPSVTYKCTKAEVRTTLISILTTWQNRTESKCLSSLKRRRFFGGGTQKSRWTRGIWKHRIPPLCLSPYLAGKGNRKRKH